MFNPKILMKHLVKKKNFMYLRLGFHLVIVYGFKILLKSFVVNLKLRLTSKYELAANWIKSFSNLPYDHQLKWSFAITPNALSIFLRNATPNSKLILSVWFFLLFIEYITYCCFHSVFLLYSIFYVAVFISLN